MPYALLEKRVVPRIMGMDEGAIRERYFKLKSGVLSKIIWYFFWFLKIFLSDLLEGRLDHFCHFR